MDKLSNIVKRAAGQFIQENTEPGEVMDTCTRHIYLAMLYLAKELEKHE